jgi:DNA-directed RNA polymerase subunit F
MKVLSTTPAPVSKIKEALEKRAEAGEELGYEQQNALEHAEEFAGLDSKKTVSLASKVRKEVPSLDEEAAMKLAELQPSTPELVKSIMLYSKIELSEEDISRILATIKG